jgi:hypothetical protein
MFPVASATGEEPKPSGLACFYLRTPLFGACYYPSSGMALSIRECQLVITHVTAY